MHKEKRKKSPRPGTRPVSTSVQATRSWVKHGHKKRNLMLVGLVLVAIVLGAWALTSSQAVGPVGKPAPDFTLQDPAHGTISKGTFQGKPLFIFFTATYCVPCQIGAQNLARYYDEKGGSSAFNVLIVFVDDRETDSQFLSWKQSYGRSDWYVAKGISMAQAYNVAALDTKYVLDKTGTIRWFDLKPLDYSSIRSIMEPVL